MEISVERKRNEHADEWKERGRERKTERDGEAETINNIIKCWSSIECNKCARIGNGPQQQQQRQRQRTKKAKRRKKNCLFEWFKSFARDHDSWWITFIYIFLAVSIPIVSRSFASIGNIVGRTERECVKSVGRTSLLFTLYVVVVLRVEIQSKNQSLDGWIVPRTNDTSTESNNRHHADNDLPHAQMYVIKWNL